MQGTFCLTPSSQGALSLTAQHSTSVPHSTLLGASRKVPHSTDSDRAARSRAPTEVHPSTEARPGRGRSRQPSPCRLRAPGEFALPCKRSQRPGRPIPERCREPHNFCNDSTVSCSTQPQQSPAMCLADPVRTSPQHSDPLCSQAAHPKHNSSSLGHTHLCSVPASSSLRSPKHCIIMSLGRSSLDLDSAGRLPGAPKHSSINPLCQNPQTFPAWPDMDLLCR